MPSVLLLCEYPTLHGGEQSMLATLDGVRREGFSIAAAAPPEGALADALRAKGVDVLPFFPRDPARGRPPQSELREELAALVRGHRPDLVHANSLSMGRLSGPVVAEAGLPSIAHLRDIVRLSPQAVADLNCHARLLAVSEATRQFHVAGGLAAERTCVLYNGVDLDRFRPRPKTGYLHHELALAPETPLVATIGQIGLRKGQDVLLAAARAVGSAKKQLSGFRAGHPERSEGSGLSSTEILRFAQDDLPPSSGQSFLRRSLADQALAVHFLIVGQRWSDKEESRRFEADLHAAARGPLADRVHFLGVRSDVDRLLNEITLLVHPARQEPLGRVLLEAAASGVPVIATDVGGTGEIFPASCQAARLIPPDDAPAMAAAIVELLNDEPSCSHLGAAARRRAEAAFDAAHAAEGLAQHYRDVLSSGALSEGRPG